MADNVQLSPGTGGANLRTLADSAGVEWPVGVSVFATTVSDGANVLQVVTPEHGLPVTLTAAATVSQATAADLQVTATQGGPWTVALADAQTIAITAADLQVTASIAGGQTIDVVQSGAWDVSATQAGAWTVALADPVSIASGQILAAVTTLGSITSAVAVSGIAGAVTVASITAPVEIADGQTITVGSITAPVALADGTAVGLAAGTALVGKVVTGADVSSLFDGSTVLTPKFALIDASTAGSTPVVAAVTGKRIRVLRWSATANGTTTAALKSGSTQITGSKYLIASAGAGAAFCPVGVCQTAAGEALNVALSASVAVSGELTYVEVSLTPMLIPYFANLLGMGAGGAIAPTGPATLRSAIRARLADTPALTDLVGPRIWFWALPQGVKPTFPAVTYFTGGRSFGRRLGGPNGVSTASVRVSLWSRSEAEAEAMADAVRLRFDGFQGLWGRVAVMGCFLDDEADLPEYPRNGTGANTYQIVLSFTIVHRVSVPVYS